MKLFLIFLFKLIHFENLLGLIFSQYSNMDFSLFAFVGVKKEKKNNDLHENILVG